MSEEAMESSQESQAVTEGAHIPLSFRGLTRSMDIPACLLSLEDLNRLYAALDRKTLEAVEEQIRPVTCPPEMDHQDFEGLKTRLRKLGHLTILVNGSKGERIVANSVQALKPEALPDAIESIAFDSAAALGTENIQPANRFDLKLDFSEPPGFFAYNPWDQATPNLSSLSVTGPDESWVTAVYEDTRDFFERRKKRRGWIHLPATFNLLHWFVGFPSALWIVFRFSQSIEFLPFHTALKGAAYVYVFLLALLVFRIVIGLSRWFFPVVELKGTRSGGARKAMAFAASSLSLALVYDVLRTLFLS